MFHKRKSARFLCPIASILCIGCSSSLSTLSGDGVNATHHRVFQASAYGLIGDGETDDSVSFQRVIQAAISAGGGQIVIGCGEFLVNTPSPAAPGQRSILYFANASEIDIIGSGSCSHLYTLLPHKSVLEFDSSTNINVSALRITGVNARYVESYGLNGGSAIRFSNVSHGSIKSVEIDGASAGAVYLTTGTSHVTVTGNNIHDTYGAGIWEDDCGGANNRNCLPVKPPSHNRYSGNSLTNTALAALSAIDLDDGNASAQAVIQNNIITWTRGPLPGVTRVHCIQLNNVSDSSVLNNHCTGSPWDAIVLTTGDKGRARNDRIIDNITTSSGLSSIGGSGIVVYNYPTGEGISDFTIDRNVVSMSATDGILIVSASGRGGVHDGIVTGNSIAKADQKNPGTRFGIHFENVMSTTVQSNNIDGGYISIAVGLRFHASSETGVSAQELGNSVTAILGPALHVD